MDTYPSMLSLTPTIIDYHFAYIHGAHMQKWMYVYQHNFINILKNVSKFVVFSLAKLMPTSNLAMQMA